MRKSSLEWAELFGLRIALSTAGKQDQHVAQWIKNRINELEKM